MVVGSVDVEPVGGGPRVGQLRPEAGPWWWGGGVHASSCRNWVGGVESRGGGALWARPGTPILIPEDL